MRTKSLVGRIVLLGFAATLIVGCDNSGSSPPMVKAPPVTDGGIQKPLPKDKMQGGGPASSGNMKNHPNDPS
jgi:hypothetical protein